MLLKALGPHIGLSSPREMFWATGALSSFLDNTPTYLVFLTTAGTLGILIPPSIVMLVYSAATEVSAAKMFMAGFIPGILMGGILMVAIYIVARI